MTDDVLTRHAHLVFTAPPDATTIWRYMDFTKFVDMLDRRALHFSRADKLGDPFEGSMPEANERSHKEALAKGPRKAWAEEVLDYYKTNRKGWIRNVYVNCWHMNEHESAAMWKLYARTNEAIAIQSTYSALRACTSEKDPPVHIGVVNYADYATDTIPADQVYWPFVFKRISFAHERELRAVIGHFPNPTGNTDGLNTAPESAAGVSVPIDVDALVQKVFVAPTSPQWFVELVGRVLVKYACTPTVRQSGLDALPTY